MLTSNLFALVTAAVAAAPVFGAPAAMYSKRLSAVTNYQRSTPVEEYLPEVDSSVAPTGIPEELPYGLVLASSDSSSLSDRELVEELMKRSFFSGLGSSAAEDAESSAGSSLGSTIFKGVLGSVLGSGVSGLLGDLTNHTLRVRSPSPSFFSGLGSSAAEDAESSAAKSAGTAAGDSLGGTLFKGILGSVIGTGVSGLLGDLTNNTLRMRSPSPSFLSGLGSSAAEDAESSAAKSAGSAAGSSIFNSVLGSVAGSAATHLLGDFLDGNSTFLA